MWDTGTGGGERDGRGKAGNHNIMLRLTSLAAVGKDVTRLAKDIAAQARLLKPDALLWVSSSSLEPETIASALSETCQACVGGVSRGGLIGGGFEYSISTSESRVVALALNGCAAIPFHSPPDGLPDLPEAAWTSFAAARTPAESPHMLLLASPPRDGAFALERWLGRLDSTLPWAKKVGGLTVGDGRLFVGATKHDGGAVGLALPDVDFHAVVCQGALPIGPSFAISASEANIIRSLDGKTVGDALGPELEATMASGGDSIMAGISVPVRPAAAVSAPAAAAIDEGTTSPYVVRGVLGYSQAHSALIVGASPELLQMPDARLQLHTFSANNAKRELRASAAALARRAGKSPTLGGLYISCLGRGPALYGESDVESALLAAELGRPLELAGLFAGGEIGPVGSRTFVHTFTTTMGLLSAR